MLGEVPQVSHREAPAGTNGSPQMLKIGSPFAPTPFTSPHNPQLAFVVWSPSLRLHLDPGGQSLPCINCEKEPGGLCLTEWFSRCQRLHSGPGTVHGALPSVLLLFLLTGEDLGTESSNKPKARRTGSAEEGCSPGVSRASRLSLAIMSVIYSLRGRV